MRKTLRGLLFDTSDWIWVGLALGLRLAFACRLGDRFHQIDELGFKLISEALASTGTISIDGMPIAAAPLPNAFFGACYRLFGPHMLYPRLLQAFLSTGTAWLIGRAAGNLTDSPRVGRLALALAAIYPFFIYYSGMLMSETLYLVCVVPGIWWLCQSLRERGALPGRAAAAGLALALAALCRAEAAPIVSVIWGAAAVFCLRGRWPWRTWLLAVLAWSLPLLFWCARNQARVGVFALDTHGGVTMLHGTMFFDENEIDTGVALAALEKTGFYQASLDSPPGQRDRIFMRQSLDFMRAHPGRTLRQWGRKFINFWRFYPRLDKTYHETQHSHPTAGLSRGLLTAVSLLFEPLLILGGLCGLWGMRRNWAGLFPIGLFMLLTMGIHLVSVSQMRYRLALMPFLILGSSQFWAARLGLELPETDQSANL
ncbi:MAG: hypothetical protein WC881_01310 [Elusimicrobiota bacterium]|jgi:hypothetical protein